MKLRLAFLSVLIAAVSGLLFWRNSQRYPSKTILWRALKSAIELGLVLLTALRLPMLLISWCCLWLTRPIQTPWIKVTVGVIAGTVLGFMSMYVLELLILAGVFSVDEITGDREGFLMNLRKAREEAQAA